MGRIIDIDQVQQALDRAAHDAKHGSADVRAGRFVHQHASDTKLPTGEAKNTKSPRLERTQKRRERQPG
jgi:hypothetical protein